MSIYVCCVYVDIPVSNDPLYHMIMDRSTHRHTMMMHMSSLSRSFNAFLWWWENLTGSADRFAIWINVFRVCRRVEQDRTSTTSCEWMLLKSKSASSSLLFFSSWIKISNLYGVRRGAAEKKKSKNEDRHVYGWLRLRSIEFWAFTTQIHNKVKYLRVENMIWGRNLRTTRTTKWIPLCVCLKKSRFARRCCCCWCFSYLHKYD